MGPKLPFTMSLSPKRTAWIMIHASGARGLPAARGFEEPRRGNQEGWLRVSLNPTGTGAPELPEPLEAELAALASPFDEAIARLGDPLEQALPGDLRHLLDELESLHWRRTAALVVRAYAAGLEARSVSPSLKEDA